MAVACTQQDKCVWITWKSRVVNKILLLETRQLNHFYILQILVQHVSMVTVIYTPAFLYYPSSPLLHPMQSNQGKHFAGDNINCTNISGWEAEKDWGKGFYAHNAFINFRQKLTYFSLEWNILLCRQPDKLRPP